MWWSRIWRKFRGNRSCWGSILCVISIFCLHRALYTIYTRNFLLLKKSFLWKNQRRKKVPFIYVLSSPTPHWAIEMKKQNKTHTHKKNRVCNRLLVPAAGNLGSLSLTPEGPVLPFVCGFRRRDNLLAWRELFVNLYELKYLVWSWVEYNHFKWIYRVYRFLRYS